MKTKAVKHYSQFRRTFYSYPFLKGFGSVLDLSGNYFEFEEELRNRYRTYYEDKNFEKVGDHIRQAMDKLVESK